MDEVKPDYVDDDEMEMRGTWNSVDLGKLIFLRSVQNGYNFMKNCLQ